MRFCDIKFGASAAIDPSLSFAGGDVLEFRVGYEGNWVEDSTKVSIQTASTSRVPLPPALVLFGSGALVL